MQNGRSMLPLDDDLRLLHDLVAIPSVSGQEAEASTFLAGWMADHGLAAHVDEVGNSVGVLDGGPGPSGSTEEIVLLGHIDTVPGRLPVEVRDGQLYGRGSVDAKGPLAAFAMAAALAGPQPGWRIVVVGAVEEEAATSRGARHIVPRHRPSLAIIGEPSGWGRITLGYKGRLLVNATVRQPMAHRSGGSISACEEAVGFWNRLSAHFVSFNSDRPRTFDQVLPTLRRFCSDDDGLYETAHLELGFRLPLDVGPESVKATLHQLNGHLELTFTGEEAAYRAPKDTLLVRSFLRAIRAQGGQPGFLVKTGTSDMNVAGPVWNCPLLAYGPGDSSLDHTPDEHVDLAEWRRGVAVLTDVLRNLPLGMP
jgi:[amino group carrier protein]-lysine/ornithine hydrolase